MRGAEAKLGITRFKLINRKIKNEIWKLTENSKFTQYGFRAHLSLSLYIYIYVCVCVCVCVCVYMCVCVCVWCLIE